MPDGQQSLEANRLEIILIAAGILILVSVMGILILLGVGLRPPATTQDSENGQRWTAWGGRCNEMSDRRTTEAYRDRDESFIGTVRRRSQSLAEEFRQELSNLQFSFVNSGKQQEDRNFLDGLQGFSIDNMIISSNDCSDQGTACGSCSELIDSPLSATGRDDGIC
ncbi:hypothetical protein EDB81DRAFT_158017 [Dactylonectria macrodidyma]|uniref:Uncharacterized protein n=1 Tax=Dactylonectria macrodidyma TaxID=307937 RepID=A0A9P9FR37_9HYPO|nr:hypothetical protein EDB81DRAFT_158017 [Dactylonectria macrodidyma]